MEKNITLEQAMQILQETDKRFDSLEKMATAIPLALDDGLR